MFDSLKDLSSKLAATGYFIDPVMTQVVFLAAKLQKPLLLEGPAGSGKTQLALSVAAAGGTHVERLQCYRGVTEDKAIGASMRDSSVSTWSSRRASTKTGRLCRQTSRAGLLSFRSAHARARVRPACVLLIDELDKVDEGFEAMLLEILSAWTLSIPEFGTVSAKSIPFVVLTSNEERRLGDPIRRRSLYVRVEHRRRSARRRSSPAALQRPMRRFTGRWRALRSRSATILSKSLRRLGDDRLRECASVARNRPRNRGAPRRAAAVPAKTEKDRRHLLLREGFKSLLDDGADLRGAWHSLEDNLHEAMPTLAVAAAPRVAPAQVDPAPAAQFVRQYAGTTASHPSW